MDEVKSFGFEQNDIHGIVSEMVSLKDGIMTPLFTVHTARGMGLGIKGEKLFYTGNGGFDHQRKSFEDLEYEGELTVKKTYIDSWHSSYIFEEVPGKWNTTMFAKNKT